MIQPEKINTVIHLLGEYNKALQLISRNTLTLTGGGIPAKQVEINQYLRREKIDAIKMIIKGEFLFRLARLSLQIESLGGKVAPPPFIPQVEWDSAVEEAKRDLQQLNERIALNAR
jgi:hypothetical protein